MFKKLALSFAAFTMAASAHAQSIPEGFYIRGNVQAEYLSDGSTDLAAGAVDFVLGYKASGISSLPVGVEVGVYKFSSDGVSFDAAITPVVFFDSQIGRFSAGVPRPALDDYIMQPLYANSVYWDLVFANVASSSYASFAQKALSTNSSGVRFDGAHGALRYGISAHRIGGLDWVTAAANYTVGRFVVAGGIEMADTAPSTGYYGSVLADFGQFTGSVSVVSPLITTSYVTQVTGTYSPMENLTLEASHLMPSTGSSFTNGSVRYDLQSGTYVGANVVSGFGASPVYGIFGGWDFNYGG